MIYTAVIETPLGELFAGSTDKGLIFLHFPEIREMALKERVRKEHSGEEFTEKDNRILTLLRSELSGYFEGRSREFSVPLALTGSDFRKEVWSALLEIPYGSTVSYIQLAFTIGRAEAVRAVANANSANPVAIVVPCHRVIGENGSLTGYAGGLWRKQWLLDHEKRFTGQPVDLNLF